MSFTGQSENPDSMQVPLIRGCGCVPLPGLSSSVNIDFVLFFKRKKKRQGGKGKGNWLDKLTKRMRVSGKCTYLQVILRPSSSTKGRSNQHRLFLRYSFHLRRLSGPSIPESEDLKSQQRIDSNLYAVKERRQAPR